MSRSQYSGKGKFIEEGWFKDSADGVALMGSRCEACRKVFFPKKEVCPNCFDGELKDLEDIGQVAFRYCDAAGNITDEANPNGSAHNIAGVTNREGNVLGMMPHPERVVEDLLGSSDGLRVFESVRAAVTASTGVAKS